MIKIVIVDDQSLMRDGLQIILNSYSQIEVLACGSNGKEALKLAEELQPDLVLMDIRMPEMDGVEASKIIKKRFPKIKILLLTTFDDEELIINAVSSGVSGYVFKDIEKEKLLQSIEDCIKGTFIMPSKVAQVLASHIPEMKTEASINTESAKKLDLTERETEIAVMISQGFSNRQIASALYISDGTVKNYVSSIYSKTGMRDRTKLALYLKKNGIE